MPKYIYANDTIIEKRVAHAVKNGWAISLVTGNKFRLKQCKKCLTMKRIKKGNICERCLNLR